MGKLPYSRLDLAAPADEGSLAGSVRLAETPVPNCPDALAHALATLRLAAALDVSRGETLTCAAPLLSLLCGRRMFFLRGWRRYEGSVKGFNALGLLAEHAGLEQRKLQRLSPAERRQAGIEYLSSRRAFTPEELAAIPDDELEKIALPLALWRAFARRPIVCSTSANLGISLHQALRDMRQAGLSLAGKSFTVLNEDEGALVVWCPDERADFMSAEKSAVLRALEAERPRLTSLHAYLNRQQRDPGALKEALASGGYFFPTNPQSRSELQNLLVSALQDLSLDDPKVRRALESLGARVVEDRVLVESAVEGGMYGMAVPYLVMLEEALVRGEAAGVCVWNPASIGAALAALALCDETLRRGPPAAPEFGASFPKLADFLRAHKLGRDLPTRIHGVFDIANLQSLAQLFGVVVTRHLSGRGTAYVGLGSSSYANGNLCFDILRRSAEENGAFGGRDHLHPATHSLNPIAQALAFAEDLHRAGREARKPEPAGAAALAGYLLARLDAGTLSFAELAFALRSGGFTKAAFLEFCGFGRDAAAAGRYIQQAGEEGESMESLVRSVLHALGWDWTELRGVAEAERRLSAQEHLSDPAVYINLTGDNCAQPSPELVAELLRSYARRGLM